MNSSWRLATLLDSGWEQASYLRRDEAVLTLESLLNDYGARIEMAYIATPNGSLTFFNLQGMRDRLTRPSHEQIAGPAICKTAHDLEAAEVAQTRPNDQRHCGVCGECENLFGIAIRSANLSCRTISNIVDIVINPNRNPNAEEFAVFKSEMRMYYQEAQAAWDRYRKYNENCALQRYNERVMINPWSCRLE